MEMLGQIHPGFVAKPEAYYHHSYNLSTWEEGRYYLNKAQISRVGKK